MKLSLEQQRAFPLLTAISTFLAGTNVKGYIVGGWVRDAILERRTDDIDIAVIADALEIASDMAAHLGGKFVALDKINKTGRIVLPADAPARQIDIATVIDDIEKDLTRRDFTMNAMAVDLSNLMGKPVSARLIDPFHGKDDLQAGTIRATGESVFAEDPLRLLRAVRFAAELHFNINSETESLIKQSAPLITQVAGERLREEILRILTAPEAARSLSYLDKLGLLMVLIPELAPLKGVEQPKEHFWDVFHHSIETVRAIDFLLRCCSWDYADEKALTHVPWSEKLDEHFQTQVSSGSTRTELLKLAALLHDLAKPETKSIEDNGKVRFFGHTDLGAEKALSIMERLRFSQKEISVVEILIRQHLRPVQMSNTGLPSRRALYRFFRDAGDTAIDVLFLSLADHLAARGPELVLEDWQEHAKQTEYILEQRFQEASLVTPPKLVDGNDLIHIFALNPGPEIGKILEAVREAQAAGELNSREQALNYIKNRLLYKERN